MQRTHAATVHRTDPEVVRGAKIAGAGGVVDVVTAPVEGGIPIVENGPEMVLTAGEGVVVGLGVGYLASRYTRMPIRAARWLAVASSVVVDTTRKWLFEAAVLPTTLPEAITEFGRFALYAAAAYGSATAITQDAAPQPAQQQMYPPQYGPGAPHQYPAQQSYPRP